MHGLSPPYRGQRSLITVLSLGSRLTRRYTTRPRRRSLRFIGASRCFSAICFTLLTSGGISDNTSTLRTTHSHPRTGEACETRDNNKKKKKLPPPSPLTRRDPHIRHGTRARARAQELRSVCMYVCPRGGKLVQEDIFNLFFWPCLVWVNKMHDYICM